MTVPLSSSEFWHGARNPFHVVHDRAIFFEKTFFAPKIGEIGFFEIWSIIFTEFVQ